MLSILNRLAWIISIGMGFIITFLFGILIGVMTKYELLDNDSFVIWLLLIGFFGILFKRMFLSKNFILSKLGEKATSQVPLTENLSEASSALSGITEQKTEKIDIQKHQIDEIEAQEVRVDNFSDSEIIKEKEVKKSQPGVISKFFSENLIAKIGGIIFFLGVAFFLNLIYTAIGPVGKIIIGFMLGFSIYGVGLVLDKKKLINESRILLGLAILINYGVILGGRFLIGDSIDNSYLSTGTTFVFLIFNTVFAIVTSLVYQSKNLLLFAFIFAFLNPLLVGGSSSTPYILIGYSIIISLGALSLSYFPSLIQSAKSLLYTAFFGGNFLILIAHFETEFAFIIKMISFLLLNLAIIYIAFKNIYPNESNCKSKLISTLFVGVYVFLAFHLGSGQNILSAGFENLGVFISYISVLFILLILGSYFIINSSITLLFATLFFPLLILFTLIITGTTLFIPILVSISLIIYLGIFAFIGHQLKNGFKYIFFIALGIFITLINIQYGFNFSETITLGDMSHLIAIISSIIFLFASYIYSKKSSADFLYSIGTIGGVLSIAPLIVHDGVNTQQIYLSAGSVVFFGLINILFPFFHKELLSKGIKSLSLGLVIGGLFLILNLFIYGTVYFPGVSLGISFIALALVYFICGYATFSKVINSSKSDKNTISKNTVYSYLGISISLITIAIALIFSKNPEIIAGAWIIESAVLIYFYSISKESKIFLASTILFFIGMIQLMGFLDVVASKDYLALISIGAIFTSMVASLKFIHIKESKSIRTFYDILHIIVSGTIGFILLEIIPSTGHGWSLLGISLFILILSGVYSLLGSKLLQGFFIALFVGFGFLHFGESEYIFYRLERENLEILNALQYITTIVIGLSLWVWNKYANSFKGIIQIVGGVYLFSITSLFIYNIFETTFAVTLYWGVLSFAILYTGITKEIIKYRTLGLYILFLTLGKIFLYDFWVGFDNGIMRVLALMIIGALMFVISGLYSKRYGGNLKGEFNLSNLNNSPQKETNNKEVGVEKSNKQSINSEISKVNISGITSIKFNVNGQEKGFLTKAKNLIRIVKYVTDNAGKVEFEAGELQETYKYLVTHYKSELTSRDLETVKKALKKFVDKGGIIEIKK